MNSGLEQRLRFIFCPLHHKKISCVNLGKESQITSRAKCNMCENNKNDISIDQIDSIIQSIQKNYGSAQNTNNQWIEKKVSEFNLLINNLQEKLNDLSIYFENTCKSLMEFDIITLYNQKAGSPNQWKINDIQELSEAFSKQIEIQSNHQYKFKSIQFKPETVYEIESIIKQIQELITYVPKQQMRRRSSDLQKLNSKVFKPPKLVEFQSFQEYQHRIVDLAIHQNDQLFISGSDGPINNLILWKYQNDKWIEISNFPLQNQGVFSLKFNYISNLLCIGGLNELIICKLINLEKLEINQRLNSENTCSHINSIEWTQNNQFIITGWSCGIIKIYIQEQQQQWKEIQTLKKHSNCINSLSISYLNQLFASASTDQSIILWSYEQKEWKYFQSLHDHKGNVWCVNFSKISNKIISCGDDNSIRIWQQNVENKSFKCSQILHDHEDSTYMVNFNSDETLIFSCSQDLSIKIRYQDEKGQWISYQTIHFDNELTPIGCYMTSNQEYLIVSLIGRNQNQLKIFKQDQQKQVLQKQE